MALTIEDCEAILKSILDDNGTIGISHSELATKHKRLLARYMTLGGSVEIFADQHDVGDEYRIIRKQKRIAQLPEEKWTTQKVDEIVEKIVVTYGFIPPYKFIKENHLEWHGIHWGMLRHGGIDKFRAKYDIKDSPQLYDKHGNRFRSFPEAALSNVLISFGLTPMIGKRYPKEFEDTFNRRAWYDLHFISPVTDRMINIEVWGSNYHDQNQYERRRKDKEKFNSETSETFIGIEYADCFSSFKIRTLLFNVLGQIIMRDPSMFYSCIDPANWSLMDVVMKRTQEIIKHFPDTIIPASSWFRKEGRFENRQVEDWEPHSWYGFVHDVERIGGFLVLRQAFSQSEFFRKSVAMREEVLIAKIKEMYNSHNCCPTAIASKLNKQTIKDDDEQHLLCLANQLITSAKTHFGNIRKACEKANVPMHHTRELTTKEAALQALSDFKTKYHIKPESYRQNLQRNHPDDIITIKFCSKVASAAKRHFGTVKTAWDMLE